MVPKHTESCSPHETAQSGAARVQHLGKTAFGAEKQAGPAARARRQPF